MKARDFVIIESSRRRSKLLRVVASMRSGLACSLLSLSLLSARLHVPHLSPARGRGASGVPPSLFGRNLRRGAGSLCACCTRPSATQKVNRRLYVFRKKCPPASAIYLWCGEACAGVVARNKGQGQLHPWRDTSSRASPITGAAAGANELRGPLTRPWAVGRPAVAGRLRRMVGRGVAGGAWARSWRVWGG